MSLPNSEMERLLAAAAELRANGSSWEAVAAKLNCDADTCREWPNQFAASWQKLYTAAEQQLVTEAQAEATNVLRIQLRLTDTKEKRDAAKTLLSFAARTRPAASKADGDPHETYLLRASDPEAKDTSDACQDVLESE